MMHLHPGIKSGETLIDSYIVRAEIKKQGQKFYFLPLRLMLIGFSNQSDSLLIFWEEYQ